MPTNRFIGSVSNLWSNASNWSLGIAPNSTTMPVTPAATTTGLISPTATTTGLISPTATTSASSTSLTFASPPSSINPALLAVGARIFGTGIPAGATVSAISGNTITMSVAATISNSDVTVAVGSTGLSFSVPPSSINPALLVVGARIFGTGIPAGATVSAISGSTINFSGVGATTIPIINGSTVAVGSTGLSFSSSPSSLDPALLVVGARIFGTGIPAGVTVSAISGTTINFSGAGTTSSFMNGGTAAVGSTSIAFSSSPTLADQTLLFVGNRIFGTGIPTGATITAILGTTVSFSIGTTGTLINNSTTTVSSPLQDIVFDANSPDCFYDYTRSYTWNGGIAPTSATSVQSLDMTNYLGTLTFNADSIAAIGSPINEPSVLGVSPLTLYVRTGLSFGAGATITSVPMSFSPSGIYPDNSWVWGDYLTSWYTLIIGATGASCSITSNGATVSTSIYTNVYSNMTIVLNDDLTISRSIQVIGSTLTPVNLRSNVPGTVRRINIPFGVKGQDSIMKIGISYNQFGGATSSIYVIRDYVGVGPHYMRNLNIQDIHASGQTITTYNSTLSNCYNIVNYDTTGGAPFGKNSSLL